MFEVANVLFIYVYNFLKIVRKKNHGPLNYFCYVRKNK